MYQVQVTMETMKGPGSWRGSVRWSRGWTRGPCVVSAPVPRGTLGGYEPGGLVDPTEHAAVRAGTRGSASGSGQGSGPRRLPGIRAASSGPWSGREGRHTTSFGPLYWLRWHPKSWLEAARGGRKRSSVPRLAAAGLTAVSQVRPRVHRHAEPPNGNRITVTTFNLAGPGGAEDAASSRNVTRNLTGRAGSQHEHTP